MFAADGNGNDTNKLSFLLGVRGRVEVGVGCGSPLREILAIHTLSLYIQTLYLYIQTY